MQWLRFIGVPVGVSPCWQCSGPLLLVIILRIVPLCRHPRVTLLGSGRYCIARYWIVLKIVLPCHRLRMILLESGHYWSHCCWNARPPSFAVLHWQGWAVGARALKIRIPDAMDLATTSSMFRRKIRIHQFAHLWRAAR